MKQAIRTFIIIAFIIVTLMFGLVIGSSNAAVDSSIETYAHQEEMVDLDIWIQIDPVTKLYHNNRFNYAVRVPVEFKISPRPMNGDGREFTRQIDGKELRATVYAYHGEPAYGEYFETFPTFFGTKFYQMSYELEGNYGRKFITNRNDVMFVIVIEAPKELWDDYGYDLISIPDSFYIIPNKEQ